MMPARHKPREVRHVDQQVSAHLVGNGTELGKVDLARHGRATCDDHLGL